MKKLLFILPLIIFFSCSVQKRHYQKGFYVSNNKQQKHTLKAVTSKQKKEVISDNLILKATPLQPSKIETADLSASLDNKTIQIIKVQLPLLTKDNDSLCDLIVLKNGDEVNAKVLEISPIEIKYKKCTMPDGPLFVIKKSDVFMIKYANGTKEIIKSDAKETTNPQNNNNNNNNNTQNSNYNGPLKTHSNAILAFIFSILGFFTYGLFSILAIIFANMALRKIKQEPNVYKGETLAKAGKIIGIITLSIIAIAVIFTVIALVLFI